MSVEEADLIASRGLKKLELDSDLTHMLLSGIPQNGARKGKSVGVHQPSVTFQAWFSSLSSTLVFIPFCPMREHCDPILEGQAAPQGVKCLPLGHTGSKPWSLYLNPGPQTCDFTEHILLPTKRSFLLKCFRGPE